MLYDWFNSNSFLSERFILFPWQVIPLGVQWKEKIHCRIHKKILVLLLYLIDTSNKLCWRFSCQGKRGGDPLLTGLGRNLSSLS